MSTVSSINSLNTNTEIAVESKLMTPQVEQVVRATRRQLARGVYTTCYCASYAVTFPIVFLAHLIPGGRPLAAGIGDGARAAIDYVRNTKASRESFRQKDIGFDEFEEPANH